MKTLIVAFMLLFICANYLTRVLSKGGGEGGGGGGERELQSSHQRHPFIVGHNSKQFLFL